MGAILLSENQHPPDNRFGWLEYGLVASLLWADYEFIITLLLDIRQILFNYHEGAVSLLGQNYESIYRGMCNKISVFKLFTIVVQYYTYMYTFVWIKSSVSSLHECSHLSISFAYPSLQINLWYGSTCTFYISNWVNNWIPIPSIYYLIPRLKKCNLTLKWAHLPVPYTIIGVSGKWLAIACKCTILPEIWIIF